MSDVKIKYKDEIQHRASENYNPYDYVDEIDQDPEVDEKTMEGFEWGTGE